MTEMLCEQLSALADDELEHAEVELLLRQYAGSSELRARWSVYHMIGEAMRRGRPSHSASQVADRVAAALDRELGRQPEQPSGRRRWRKMWRPVGAAAIAASVGVAAVLVVRGQAPEVVPIRAGSSQARAGANAFNNYNTVSNVRWNQGSPQVRRQLNEYLFDHNENAPALGRQGMLPYVHMAAFYASPTLAATQDSRKRGGHE